MATPEQINAVLFAARKGLAVMSEHANSDAMEKLWAAFNAVASSAKEQEPKTPKDAP